MYSLWHVEEINSHHLGWPSAIYSQLSLANDKYVIIFIIKLFNYNNIINNYNIQSKLTQVTKETNQKTGKPKK